MNCYNCGQKFYIKRSFLTLFETKKYYICNRCRSSYQIQLKMEHVPLENFTVSILSIFEHLYHLNLESYCLEVSKIVFHFILNKPEYFVVFLEKCIFNDDMLECLNFLAEGEKKSILLICCELKK